MSQRKLVVNLQVFFIRQKLSYSNNYNYSVFDQQLKQRIPFIGGTCLENFDGNVFIASNDSVYSLVPVPWEKQVQMLLSKKKVKEALDLSQNSVQAGVTKEVFNRYIKQIKQQAGFIEFADQNFEEARNLFIEGDLDVRELLFLYTNLLPVNDDGTYKSTIKHEIVDINQLANDNPETLFQYNLFLFEYLQELKCDNSEQYLNHKHQVDTVLVILSSTYEPLHSYLIDLITNNKLELSNWIIKQLQDKNHYHALGIYYSQNNQYENAWDIWKQLELNQIKDSSYPGLDYIANFLGQLNDEKFIMNHIDFILERNQNLGVSVLIKHKSSKLSHEMILTHLKPFSKAELHYLEYLIFDCNSEVKFC